MSNQASPAPKGAAPQDQFKLVIESPKEAAEPRTLWWLGLLPTAPRKKMSIAGIEFVDFTDYPVAGAGTEDTGGVTPRSHQKGVRLALTKSQIEKIFRKLQGLWVRWESRAKGRGMILDQANAKTFGANDHDEPLSMHVYAASVESASPEVAKAMTVGGLPPSAYEMYGDGKRPMPKPVAPKPAPVAKKPTDEDDED